MHLSLKKTSFAITLFAASSAFAANPIVDVDTSMGDFKIELYPEKAPKTVANFLKYVDDGSYVGTQFHRVIPGFVVQGGGFDKNFTQLPTSYGTVANESKNGLSNQQATLAMARTQDPDSATRQFYINLTNNTSLDASPYKAGYTVFAKVIEGYEVVEKIATVKTGNSKGHQNVPLAPVLIEKISVEKK